MSRSERESEDRAGGLPAVRPCPRVLARQIGDEHVLIHLDTDRVLSLNATGGRIWELIGEGVQGRALVERLCREFQSAAPEALTQQVDQFLRELLELELVEAVRDP